MNRKHLTALHGALASMALAMAFTAQAAEPALYMYSTIDALLAGTYDGELTVKQLRTKGNFGLGTYNHLDGELLMLDGVCYHIRADGTISVANSTDKVPLAAVLPFKASEQFTLRGDTATALNDVEKSIDAKLKNLNLFYAVKIHGQFADISTRAIAPQVRPYKPLAEVAKTQTVFKRDAVSGTLVGFRSPAFSKGISVPGWHWHFIADDKSFGGHVLSSSLVKGTVSIAAARHFDVELPLTDDFAQADQSKDRSVELHQVEK